MDTKEKKQNQAERTKTQSINELVGCSGYALQFLGLLKGAGMAVTEEIVNAICIYANWSTAVGIGMGIVSVGCVLVLLLPLGHYSFSLIHSPALLCSALLFLEDTASGLHSRSFSRGFLEPFTPLM